MAKRCFFGAFKWFIAKFIAYTGPPSFFLIRMKEIVSPSLKGVNLGMESVVTLASKYKVERVILQRDTTSSLSEWLAQMGARLLKEALDKLGQGSVTVEKQGDQHYTASRDRTAPTIVEKSLLKK